uniref:Uncharacterized protein n=1 Tax=Zea mays TaxID=4577 RepID=B6UHE0_MAIZE|nr:hypothetical protein [Zea mays]
MLLTSCRQGRGMASLSCARADGVVRSGALPAKLLLCASCCFPTAAPVADGEVQVLACRQHLHRLPRRQDLRRQRPRRRHPQLVGLHQQPRQRGLVAVQRRVHLGVRGS